MRRSCSQGSKRKGNSKKLLGSPVLYPLQGVFVGSGDVPWVLTMTTACLIRPPSLFDNKRDPSVSDSPKKICPSCPLQNSCGKKVLGSINILFSKFVHKTPGASTQAAVQSTWVLIAHSNDKCTGVHAHCRCILQKNLLLFACYCSKKIKAQKESAWSSV